MHRLRQGGNVTKKQSVKNFNWVQYEVNLETIKSYLNNTNVSEIIARLLINRNVELHNVDNFLNPTIRNLLPDPFHLLDMQKAAEIVVEAIIQNKKIAIFGDYDVDGATSSALLKRFFNLINAEALIYIPDRIGEGYGPTVEAFSYLKENGCKLIITVDCGTSAFEAISYGKQQGLEIVVIDHHLSGDELPIADAIVNPNRKDETTEYKYLAAVGVAFLFAVAITTTLRKKHFFKNRSEPKLLELLDIVAIGTICDVVPLEMLNRAFVTQGLKMLNSKKNIGTQAFCQLLNIDTTLTPYHIGYVFGPRINAGGRVGESSLGANLLSTDDLDLALEIAKKLELYNLERKAIEQSVFEIALEQAKNHSQDDVLIVAQGENWHQGVVGIVAGRIKEILDKPVAVITIDGEFCKASCRSINGIDFGTAVVMAKEKGILLSGGGHKMAAGFTLHKDNLGRLKSFLNERFTKELAAIENQNSRYFDAYLSTSGLSLELAKTIEKLGPFGPSNHEPKFILKDVNIVKTSIFGENNISCFIMCTDGKKHNQIIKANAFRALETKLGQTLLGKNYKKLDVVGYLRINRWKNRENIEFSIEDAITHND